LAHHSRHWWGAQGPRRTRGRGKSGGARIIYYIVTRKSVLYLLDAYAKNDKDNLSHAERQEIHALVAALDAQA
jgi:hypothetical protein